MVRVQVPDDFARAMDDDLSIPQVLATLHESVRAGNQALDSGETERATELRASVIAMVDVLGLNPQADQWSAGSASNASEALAGVVDAAIEARNAARAAKNFDLADSLRDVLSDAGVDVVDTENGSEWSFSG